MRSGGRGVGFRSVDRSIAVPEHNPFDDVVRGSRFFAAQSDGSGRSVVLSESERSRFGSEEISNRFVVDFEIGNGEGEIGIVGFGGDAVEEIFHDEKDDTGLIRGSRDGVRLSTTSCLGESQNQQQLHINGKSRLTP